MHKRIVNTASIKLCITPVGPVLIKSGREGGDPTKPDMEFVETYCAKGKTIYLPGSSLKGALRAHCERIARTVGSAKPAPSGVWACDPLDARQHCRQLRNKSGEDTFNGSCTICRLFGSTEMSSHFRIEDAYPDEPITVAQTEERNGVAIDRVFGSVAVGPFNYQVVTRGDFRTAIHLKNFTTSQLGLVALAIRDFDQQAVGLGFAKSRGMGNVSIKVESMTFRYPAAEATDGRIASLTGSDYGSDSQVLGAGRMLSASGYNYVADDLVDATVITSEDDYGYGVVQKISTSDHVHDLWRACVGKWRQEAERMANQQ